MAERYHEIFQRIHGTQNPLTELGRYLSRFLSCGLPEERADEYTPGDSPMGCFGYEEERPPVFVIETPEHNHLLSLALWVSKKIDHPRIAQVFSFSLTCDGIGESPSEEVMASACQCTHALFRHLMLDREIELSDPGALRHVLELPLALSASASGSPHLTPEFHFMGFVVETDSCNVYSTLSRRSEELGLAWKAFFKRYKQLRRQENGKRAFRYAGNLYRIALASQWWDDFCWSDGEQCIEESFKVLEPDIFCVLDYLRGYLNNDELLISDGSAGIRDRFSFKNLYLPIVYELRSESWYELASSLLCVYLVVSAAAAEGDLDELEGIAPQILASRGTPGYQFVSRTIDFICEYAQRQGHDATYMMFDQFRLTTDERISSLIDAGESETCEFKSTLRVNLFTGSIDKKMEHGVLKSIAAFVNKRGGSLLVGVRDDGTICGIEEDRFENADKCALHLKNLLSGAMREALDLVALETVTHKRKTVLLVDCKKGTRPVYLKNRETNEEEFYVRRGPSTDRLSIREAVAYIEGAYPDADQEGDL